MATETQKKDWNWFGNSRSQKTPVLRNAGNNLAAPYYLQPFSSFFSDMDRMFHTTFRNFGWPSLPGFAGSPALFQPSVNIASTDDEYTITVEAPGMEEKDIKLDISPDGMLTISGEKRLQGGDKNRDYEYAECSYGAFQRSLSLPDDVDEDAIEANFKNGVLTITCPRAQTEEKPKARHISIGKGGSSGSSYEGSSRPSATGGTSKRTTTSTSNAA